jgi:phospholipid/cholesterol/gamma-HCH transport system ATP-binding protein
MSTGAPTPDGVSIRVRGLRKSLNGQEILKGLDFEVSRGEIFVIMGPSGCGKTVLLKHLIGLLSPDGGEILIEGEPIQAAGVLDRHRMAMVFQSGALLNSLTVGENVGLYLSEHRLKPPEVIAEVVTEKLALVGLQDAANKMPGELSGGMKKRASIARALVSEPQLILYDEPTSELDPLMAVTVGEEILNLNRQMEVTSVVVTHDRDLAFGIADRIALMSDGQIVALGTPSEIRQTKHPLLQEFLSASFQFNPVVGNERHS